MPLKYIFASNPFMINQFRALDYFFDHFVPHTNLYYFYFEILEG